MPGVIEPKLHYKNKPIQKGSHYSKYGSGHTVNTEQCDSDCERPKNEKKKNYVCTVCKTLTVITNQKL